MDRCRMSSSPLSPPSWPRPKPTIRPRKPTWRHSWPAAGWKRSAVSLTEKRTTISALEDGKSRTLSTYVDELVNSYKRIVNVYLDAQTSDQLLAFQKEQEGQRSPGRRLSGRLQCGAHRYLHGTEGSRYGAAASLLRSVAQDDSQPGRGAHDPGATSRRRRRRGFGQRTGAADAETAARRERQRDAADHG